MGGTVHHDTRRDLVTVKIGHFICQPPKSVIMMSPMKIFLSHPVRDMELKGPKRVKDIFRELNLIPEAYLVIRGQDLMTEDEMVRDEEAIEIRPVISGG